MNRKLLALFLFLPSLAFGNDFDNWYFNSLLKPSTSSTRYLDSEGEEFSKMTGTYSGGAAQDGKSFIEKGKETEPKTGKIFTYTITWTKNTDGTYAGALVDSNKGTSKISLTIVDEKSCTAISEASNGFTFTGMGRLQNDGRIYYEMTGLDKTQTVSITITTWVTPEKP